MNCQLSQSSVLVPHSLTERFVAAAGEATRAALSAFQATWRNHAPQADQASAFELMADINEHTLRDIGAPNWLIAQAVERKGAHHLHLLELHRS
jgi:hypothetical protein